MAYRASTASALSANHFVCTPHDTMKMDFLLEKQKIKIVCQTHMIFLDLDLLEFLGEFQILELGIQAIHFNPRATVLPPVPLIIK